MDVFVPRPYQLCTYEGPEMDLGFDAKGARLWAEIFGKLGPGETTGAVDPLLEVDYKPEEGSYQGFIPWDIGPVDARYIKCKATIDTDTGVALLEKFSEIADVQDVEDSGQDVAISASGTTINFNETFHLAPKMRTEIKGSIALFSTVDQVTTTSFKVYVFNSSGVGVAGTIDWFARGA